MPEDMACRTAGVVEDAVLRWVRDLGGHVAAEESCCPCVSSTASQPGRGVNRWTDAQREEALRICRAEGPNEACRRTGIPRPTISAWERITRDFGRCETCNGLHSDCGPA